MHVTEKEKNIEKLMLPESIMNKEPMDGVMVDIRYMAAETQLLEGATEPLLKHDGLGACTTFHFPDDGFYQLYYSFMEYSKDEQ